MDKINYAQEVKKIHPKAKCYNTGTILGGHLKVYHIGIMQDGVVKILTPHHMFAGNKNKAYEYAYNYLKTSTNG